MAHKTIAIGAAAALAGAVVLRRLGVEPVPTVFYLLAWYPTLLLLDAVVAAKGGPSLWDQPRDTAAMLWWSVVIWCGFEALNFRLRDWYYVFVPASPWQRWLGISVSFATVVPAILLPERLLDRLGVARRLVTRPVRLAPRDLRLAVVLGAALLGRAGAAVVRAALWVVFVILALAGIDRWTVSSTVPYVDQVPGVSATARTRLATAGFHDVFRLASLPPDTVAARVGLPPDEAREVVEAARLVTFRGIGTRHAAWLRALGVTSIADLARADPDSLCRVLPPDPHPTAAEGRVWVRAARDTPARDW